MSDRTKELILKTLLVVALALLSSIIPVGIFLAIFFPDMDTETATAILNTLLLVAFGVGILCMILMFVFGGLKRKPVKADKYPFAIASYSELLEFLQERLLQRKYKFHKTMPISSNGEITVYLKPAIIKDSCYFAIVRVSELSDELTEEFYTNMDKILADFQDGKSIMGSVDVISLYCVDRITPAFQKLVNTNLQQGLKNGRFIAGISFGGNNVYLAKQEDGFAIMKYKQLREEFIDIMELKDVKK